jgi:hypothetical protein
LSGIESTSSGVTLNLSLSISLWTDVLNPCMAWLTPSHSQVFTRVDFNVPLRKDGRAVCTMHVCGQRIGGCGYAYLPPTQLQVLTDATSGEIPPHAQGRLRAALPTINYILERNPRVLMCASCVSVCVCVCCSPHPQPRFAPGQAEGAVRGRALAPPGRCSAGAAARASGDVRGGLCWRRSRCALVLSRPVLCSAQFLSRVC